MGSGRLRQRGVVGGLSTSAAASIRKPGLNRFRDWMDLVQALHAAEIEMICAMRALNEAERRYFDLPPDLRGQSIPLWYENAQEEQAAAALNVDRIALLIAAHERRDWASFSVKLNLVAQASGLDLQSLSSEDEAEQSDLVEILIRSLIRDVSNILQALRSAS